MTFFNLIFFIPIFRVHASPSLNKRNDGNDSVTSQSPRRVNPGHTSPQTSTVQDTDDRIPKDSIYGTIRTKGKTRPITEGESLQALNTVHQHIISGKPVKKKYYFFIKKIIKSS